MDKQSKPLFSLGRTTATPGALDLFQRTGVSPGSLLARHQFGDWGAVEEEDRGANDRAVIDGARILSVYEVGAKREKLYILTESDRSATTALLPSEY